MQQQVRRVLWLTFAAALAGYCVVQDRVTAAGARRYVAAQQEAIAGRGPAITVDDMMRPAVARSVRLGLACSGAVAAVGVGLGLALQRSARARAADSRIP